MKEKEEGDPFLMVQIISSAIVNVPPPQALLTILNQNSSFITFNGNTEERMYNLFKRSPNGNTVSLITIYKHFYIRLKPLELYIILEKQ